MRCGFLDFNPNAVNRHQQYKNLQHNGHDDWRKINETTYRNLEEESQGWSIKKISILRSLANLLKNSIDLNVKHVCSSCGKELSTPLYFQGEWAALFLYKDEDILSQLS